jgi:hypothetical protein
MRFSLLSLLPRSHRPSFNFPGNRLLSRVFRQVPVDEYVIAVIAITAWQRIGIACRALIMAMYKNKLNSVTAEETLCLHYCLLNIEPIQLPASMSQAMPKCTINPPQMLLVFKLTMPSSSPPQKLLIASPMGLPKCMLQ